MSYTLRGRLESRLAAAALTLVLAVALAALERTWWPVELAGLMTVVGLVLDAELYHRLLPYQPGWVALPLGVLELALVVTAARALGIAAPLGPALALFGAGWLVAQILGHAALPRMRLSYAEDGGELGRAGPALGVVVLVVFACSGGVAWAQRPPTVHLAAGVHQGPLVIDRSERLVGETGAVVRGGIVIRSDDVTVRNVTVLGGDDGIDVTGADNVVLDGVTISGARLDGIHVRDSSVTIRDCAVDSLGNRWAQGIDISFSMARAPSKVEGCSVVGGREGIVVHTTHAMLVRNRVSRTSSYGISLTEMAMGGISSNNVRGAQGVAIYCGDNSECEIDDNVVTGTEPGADWSGYGILVHYNSHARVRGNRLISSPGGVKALSNAQIER
ncbi:MAG: nitrous oxidase accessory protein [Thermoleophilales bacterium]|nr:nitrous oxidase accessory protein [Thermoleophilales bacterium]